MSDADRAVQMRLEGKGYAAIAKKLGVSQKAVWDWIASECIYPSTKQLLQTERAVSAARLDAAYETCRQIADDPDAANKERISACATIKAIEERRSKLFGLDAPDQVTTIITDGTDVSETTASAREAIRKLRGHVGPGEAK